MRSVREGSCGGDCERAAGDTGRIERSGGGHLGTVVRAGFGWRWLAEAGAGGGGGADGTVEGDESGRGVAAGYSDRFCDEPEGQVADAGSGERFECSGGSALGGAAEWETDY